VLLARLWTLQVVDAKSYAAQVTKNQVRVVTVAPSRGEIVDRNDTVLAGGTPVEEMLLSRVSAAAHPTVVAKVAALVGQTPIQVQTTVNNDQYGPYEPIPVATNIPAATVQYLQVHESEFPGVSVQAVTTRTYPQGATTAAHVLGYLGDITSTFLAAHKNAGYAEGSQVGVSGIEQQYETYLRGVNGRQALEVDASGNVVGTLSSTAPQTGDTVVLNIDTGLQKAVEADLANQIQADRQTTDKVTGFVPPAKNGAVIVMNPQNGQVLAMASYPTYNINDWVGGISSANYAAISSSGAENNNAIQGLYIPGSTFKLITATADLQDGVYNPNQYYPDTGKYVVTPCNGAASACTFHDDQDSGAGDVNLADAIAVSSDAYFYQLGDLFCDGRATWGNDAIQNVGHQYGEGDLTGIDLPNEVLGRIDSLSVRQTLHAEAPKAFMPASWNDGDNIEMAFGQGGTVVTPIEQAVAYSTFANGGTRYQPQVANAIVNPVTGQVVKQFTPVVTGHVSLPPNVYDPILTGLEGVINMEGGTAGPQTGDFVGFPSNFELAGKTGTATTVNSSGSAGEPTSWFVAFGPQPKPTYLVLAVIYQGGYGASAAAPLVRSVFNYIYANPIGGVTLPTGTNPSKLKAPASHTPLTTPSTTTTSPPSTTTYTPTTSAETTPPTSPPATTTVPPATTTTPTTPAGT